MSLSFELIKLYNAFDIPLDERFNKTLSATGSCLAGGSLERAHAGKPFELGQDIDIWTPVNKDSKPLKEYILTSYLESIGYKLNPPRDTAYMGMSQTFTVNSYWKEPTAAGVNGKKIGGKIQVIFVTTDKPLKEYINDQFDLSCCKFAYFPENSQIEFVGSDFELAEYKKGIAHIKGQSKMKSARAAKYFERGFKIVTARA